MKNALSYFRYSEKYETTLRPTEFHKRYIHVQSSMIKMIERIYTFLLSARFVNAFICEVIVLRNHILFAFRMRDTECRIRNRATREWQIRMAMACHSSHITKSYGSYRNEECMTIETNFGKRFFLTEGSGREKIVEYDWLINYTTFFCCCYSFVTWTNNTKWGR